MSRRADGRAPLVELTGVTRRYGRDGVPVLALRGVDLAVAEGEFLAVMGPSGSGKSTLLNVIGLLDAEYEGAYRLDGQLVSGLPADALSSLRNRSIGFVFQQFHLLPQLSLLENAALPALYARDRSAAACEAEARRRLCELGLAERLHHRPNQVSAGQRQRAAIARALVNRPRLLLADEPTGALDSKTAGEILELLAGLHREGTTLVLITHDREVAGAAERIVHVLDGQTLDGLG